MAFPAELLPVGVPSVQAMALGGQGASLAALGSLQTDAAPVLASLTIVTAADGTKGVILPNVEVGSTCELFNNSASTLKVWPPVGESITVNGTGLGTANAAFSHLTFKVVRYTCVTPTQWLSNVSA